MLLNEFEKLLSVVYERLVFDFVKTEEVLISPQRSERKFVESYAVCVSYSSLVFWLGLFEWAFGHLAPREYLFGRTCRF